MSIKVRKYFRLTLFLVIMLYVLYPPSCVLSDVEPPLIAQAEGTQPGASAGAPAGAPGSAQSETPSQTPPSTSEAAPSGETKPDEGVIEQEVPPAEEPESEGKGEESEIGKELGDFIRAQAFDFPRRFGYEYFTGARNRITMLEAELGGARVPRAASQLTARDAISGFVGPVEMMGANVAATVPSKYVLNPGDRLTIQFWSDILELQTIHVVIDSKGEVIIPNIGSPIVARGMTLAQFQSAVKAMLERVAYKNLNLVAMLDSLRSIQIFITGEAFRPGSYAVSAVTTLFNTLYMCGGPSRNGSLRDIKLLRNSESITVDFYKFLMYGDSSQDFSLEAGDTVFISPVGRTVTISGEVKRPAVYELKEGENLQEIISLAGGLLPSGFLQRIQIGSVDPGKQRILLDVDLTNKELLNPPLFDGDTVRVFSIPSERMNTVTVEGKVRMPGEYQLKEGMTVTDLIKAAQWLLGEAYTERADLLRLNPDRKTIKLIPVNLSKALSGDIVHNVILNQWDKLVVYSKDEIQWVAKREVSVRGAVKKPGSYERSDGMIVGDLLMKAGGLTPEAYLDKAFLLRMDEREELTKSITINLKSTGNDVELKDGDSLMVYRYQEALWEPKREITIRGAVQRPSIYRRIDGMKISDLIQLAGGFLPDAYPDRALLLRLDERMRITQGFFIVPKLALRDDPKNNLELRDGDTLTIYTYRQAIWEPERIVTIVGAVHNPGDFIIPERPGVAKVEGVERPAVIELPGTESKKLESPFVIGQLEAVKPEAETPFLSDKEKPSEVSERRGSVFERVDGMRVSDLINRAGGLLPNAYMERADLRRYRSDYETYITIPVNLSKVISGNKEADILLQDGDMLTVYTIREVQYEPKNIVIMYGAVQRPDIYTRTIGMKLSDLLFMAGGLLPGALKDAEITRIDRSGKTATTTVDVIALAAGDESQDILLEDGDVVSIRKDNEFQDVLRTVEIKGEVKYPGRYALKLNERLSDLIKRAGGLTSRAYPEAAVITRDTNYLVLDEQRKSSQQVKKLLEDLSQDEYQREVAKIRLIEERRKTYREATETPTTSIPIIGAQTATAAVSAIARIPEQTEAAISSIENITQQMYTLVTPARAIPSFIPPGRVVVNVREAIESPGRKDDIILEDRDEIMIPVMLDTISVTGAVIQPSSLVYIRSIKPKTVKDYIEMAGGYSRDADTEAVYVVKANGMVVKGEKADLDPGDMIIVPTKIMITKITDRWGQVITAVKFTVTTLAIYFTIKLVVDTINK